MALQTSGPISLNDMHVEAGGSSGTNCTINDTDIRGLIGKASGATMSFNEWYGASAGFSFNVTVANSGTYYALYGFRRYSGVTGFGSPSSPVTVDTNVQCSAVMWQAYPAAGTPAAYIYFNTGGSLIDPTTDPAYANMYFTVSNGTYTTGQLPVGSSAVAARQSAYFTSITDRVTSGPNNYAYISNKYLTQYDVLWPTNQPPTSNNTVWTVDISW